MASKLRWGLLSTGNIAGQFAHGLAGARRGRAISVASRTRKSAEQFAEQYGIEKAHGSYEALLDDDEVDAVYLALPNSMHHAWTLRALESGKHVLCEKPMACSAAETEQMFDAADRADRVLVEAFMYRSHPLLHAAVDQVRRGAIGRLRMIRTSFCYCTKRIEDNIRFDRGLAGGALMDVGCYCIDFAQWLAEAEPAAADATGHIHATGVDDVVVGTLRFADGLVASFTCGITVHADNTAYLCGDEGYIEIPVPWKPPTEKARYVVKHSPPPRQDKPAVVVPPPIQAFEVDGLKPLYALEADDFAATVLDAAPPRVTREQSMRTARTLDQLRNQIDTR